MRQLVEIGRFFVTALAVAIAIVTFLLVVSLVTESAMSPDVFLILIGIAFVCALIGGLFLGLPILWIAMHLDWHRDPKKLAAAGVAAGALNGTALSVPTYGSLDVINYATTIFPFWGGMGALAGLVASQVWFLLHRVENA